jgi:phosphomannomutase
MELIVSYSGIRFCGESPEDIGPAFSIAYSEYLTRKWNKIGTVALARDTRDTSAYYRQCFASSLSNNNLVDLGVCPIPSLQWVMNNSLSNVIGGVMISGSHNDSEWNGYKLLQPSGLCLNHNDIMEIYTNACTNIGKKTHLSDIKEVVFEPSELWKGHLHAVYNNIKGNYSGLKVAVDTCNGAARVALPMLLKMYGCEVI